MEWQRVDTTPFDRDLELAVMTYDGAHALVFPCRRILGGWMNAETKKPVTVYPTHWRESDAQIDLHLAEFEPVNFNASD